MRIIAAAHVTCRTNYSSIICLLQQLAESATTLVRPAMGYKTRIALLVQLASTSLKIIPVIRSVRLPLDTLYLIQNIATSAIFHAEAVLELVKLSVLRAIHRTSFILIIALVVRVQQTMGISLITSTALNATLVANHAQELQA